MSEKTFSIPVKYKNFQRTVNASLDVLEIVKAKLPAAQLPPDLLLAIQIEEVGQSIKTYCNRTDIPPGLLFIQANMVIDLIKQEIRDANPDAQTTVKSVKEGDVSVDFGSAGVGPSARAMESMLYSYREQLNKFRKMQW